MKSILRIARTELNILFFSPIAWLLLIVFMLQTSMKYAAYMGYLANLQYVGNAGMRKLTHLVFSDIRSVFQTVLSNLYYFVPLLTMGLLSRELQSGSIKLLQSSPITLPQIILGKYLAAVGYFFLFVLFLFGLMLMTGVMVEHLDYPLVLAGLLGVFLLASTYAAIGLFMSSLTTHQVVAAISTFALLFVLGFIGTLGQRIPFIADLAYWLSIQGRVDYSRMGLLASKDILYFLSIIVLFLSFTYFKLSAGRKIESGVRKASKYLATLCAVVLFGYVSSQPGLSVYWDTTREKTMTLSEGSQAIMAELEGPWRITVYANVLHSIGYRFSPQSQNRLERRLFEQYQRANPELNIEYVYYYGPSDNQRLYENNPGKSDEELAREYAHKRRLNFDKFLSAEAVSERANVVAEDHDQFYVLEWQDRSSIVRNFDDMSYYPGERELSAGLKRMLDGPTRIAFVTGHGERSAYQKGDRDYQRMATERTYRTGMRNHGFEVMELSLAEALPAEVDTLVIADPKEAYSSEELDNLNAFIARGGNLLIAGEPERQDILNPMVEGLGLEFLQGRIVEPKPEYPEALLFAQLSEQAGDYSFEVGEFAVDRPFVINGAAILHYTQNGPFEAIPILVADAAEASLQSELPVAIEETALALAMRRKINGQEQRLMVVSDADFMSTAGLTRPDPANNNFEFVLDTLGWLSNDAYPVDTSRPPFIDRNTSMKIENVIWLKYFLYGFLPLGLFVWGGTLLMLRRRK